MDGSAGTDALSDCDEVLEADRCRLTGGMKYYCNTMMLMLTYSGYRHLIPSMPVRLTWPVV